MLENIDYRIAAEAWEFDQIHELNYRTFVQEIPQHPPNAAGALVDAFHSENTYFIAARGRVIVGMIALRGTRPFSLERKLPNLDTFLPPHTRLCEVRLLATNPDVRGGPVFHGLVSLLVRHAVDNGFDLAIISGALKQTKLYRHLGFIPFGPQVGAPKAPYQPMYLTLDNLRAKLLNIGN